MVEFLGILSVGYPCRSDRTGLLSPQLSLLSQAVSPLRGKKRILKTTKVIKKKNLSSIRAEIILTALIQDSLVNTSTLHTVTPSETFQCLFPRPNGNGSTARRWCVSRLQSTRSEDTSPERTFRRAQQQVSSFKSQGSGLGGVRTLKGECLLLHLAKGTEVFQMQLL